MKKKIFFIVIIVFIIIAGCNDGSNNDDPVISDPTNNSPSTDNPNSDNNKPSDKNPPNAPYGIKAVADSSSSITITWNAVRDVESYKIYRNEKATGTYTEIGESTTTSYTDTGLAPNTTYYYKVSAINEGGESGFSLLWDYAKTLDASPDTPQNVSATAISSSSIIVTWDEVPDADKYIIYRSNSYSGTYEKIAESTTAIYTDTELPVMTQFYYKVSACNSEGESSLSFYDSAKINVLPPAVPQNVSATAISSSSITVTWDEVPDADKYIIYRSTSSFGTYVKIAESTTATYTDTELTPDTNYYYRVTAINIGGESSQSIYDFTKTLNAPPNTPMGLSATPLYLKMIYLSWAEAANATGYRIYRSTSEDGEYTQVSSTTSSTTHYNDTNSNNGLTVGTTYYYKVSAYNSAGESETSLPVSAQVLANTEGLTHLSAIPITSSGTIGYFPQGLDEIWFTLTRTGAGILYAEDRDLGISSGFSGDITVTVLKYVENVFYIQDLENGKILENIDIGKGISDANNIYVNNWDGTYYIKVKLSTKNIFPYRGIFKIYFTEQ